jgi:SAM-dependent methyltransferase
MERHRLLAVLLQSMASYISTSVALLDVAPNDATTRVLDRMKPPRRIGLDFDPGADGRNVDVQASIEALPFASASFDVIICYHVLEHVVDDGRAMREIGRVLMPGGFALVQVPWRSASATDEDPSAPAQERARRFGQADHVRSYGHDLDDRLRANGLSGARMVAADLLTPEVQRLYGTSTTGPIWFLRQATRRATAITSPDPQQVRLPFTHRAGGS